MTEAPPPVPEAAPIRDALAELEAACTVPPAAWDDGPVELRATRDSEPFATFSVAQSMSVLIPSQGVAAVVAQVDGWTIRGFAPGARVVRANTGIVFQAYYSPRYRVLWEPRGVKDSKVRAVTLPPGFASEIDMGLDCGVLTAGRLAAQFWEQRAGAKYAYLRKGTTVEPTFAPDAKPLQQITAVDHARVEVEETRGAHVYIRWYRCDGTITGWIAKGALVTTPPDARKQWDLDGGGACLKVTPAPAPAPPVGERLRCPKEVGVVVATPAGARRVGSVPPGTEIVVLRRDEHGFAEVVSARGGLRPGGRAPMTIALSDLGACSP